MLHFPPVNNSVVLILVLYDLLCFINVNEQYIKRNRPLRSLLREVETDKAREKSAELMDVNHERESKVEKNDFAKLATTNGVEVSVPTPRSVVLRLLQNKLIEDL
ncbi:hypothetical protein TNCV_2747371 [Trichonephila clavipes]|nr:hypothetical protein TNCV_2747371 [Trichonephila clavipes]